MKVFSILVAAPLFAACQDATPARIELAKSSAVILDETPVSVGATVVTKGGRPVTTANLTYSASPATVVTIGDDGAMRCRSSGDASVLVAGGGQSATMSVSCRLVGSIEVPGSVRLVLGNKSNAVPITVRDDSGRILTDVPLTTTTSAPGVARYANGSLTPIGVGQTTVTMTAGRATSTVHVDVVQLVESKTVALVDGAAEVFTLQQGAYDVDIKVRTTNGSPYGVTVSWVGADCPAAKESQEHRIHCSVGETASMTVLNPTAFGLGPAATGFINIYRTAQ